MRDTRRLRERNVQRPERIQIVWLTLGMVVSLALTFAFGFMMGRRVQRIQEPAAPSGADAIARIQLEEVAHKEQLTFYKQLTDEVAASAPAAEHRQVEEAVAATPLNAASTPAEAHDDLASAMARARAAAAPPAKSNLGAAQLRSALDAGPAAAGDYTVQVSAFQSMGEARAFSAGLERKGYRPFVVTTDITGRGTWYRVRMGRFTDEASAAAAKQVLATADIPAWVLRTE